MAYTLLKTMRRSHLCCGVLLLCFLLLLNACSFDAVGQFASQSSQALAQGPAILKDIEGSCVRKELSESSYFGLDQPDQAAAATAKATAACAQFADETHSLLAASKALTDYFTAISELAAGGKTDAGKDASQDKATASKAAKTPHADAIMKQVGGILDVLGKMATAGYRDKRLQADLKSVAPDVEAVLGALKMAGSDSYTRVLIIEQRTYERRFNVLLQDLPSSGDAQVKLLRVLARDNLSEQARVIAAKEAAAKAYGEAIDKILAGYKTLVSQQGKLDAKDMVGVMQPYTSSLMKLSQSLMQLF